MADQRATDSRLFDELRDLADERGARIGVTDCEPFDDAFAGITQRVASGASGALGFTFNDPRRATAPSTSFPWASSIVVAAVPYLRDGDGGTDARTVARFADGDRYEGLRDVLAAVSGVLERHGWQAEAVFDDDRLVDRAAAVRAGVAWWGKSSMALTPGLGPWFLIGSVLTDAPLASTPPMDRSCGTCVACIPACPTGAIVVPGVIDARRCLAAVFQSRGVIDPELREAAGTRVYGCDDCLTACPPGDRELMRHAPGASPSPREILAMSDRDLDAFTGHWYVPGRSMRFVRRNALVAMGNENDDANAAVLAGYVGHPDPLLRRHAAWAMRGVATSVARPILRQALTEESDSEVIDEIEASLAALGGHTTLGNSSTLTEPD